MNVVKAIITAMKEEADLVITRFDLKEQKTLKHIKIYEWEREIQWETEKIVLVLSGIWKIQSAIAAAYVFENYDVTKLINIWVAWKLSGSDDIKVGDVFLPNTFLQHDVYLPFEWKQYEYVKSPLFIDYAIWESYDLKKFGLILSWVCVSWDQFIDNQDKILELRAEHAWDIVEMEAYWILSVAREYNMLDKCVVIKAVSDWADSDAKDDVMSNLDFAMQNSVDVLELIL